MRRLIKWRSSLETLSALSGIAFAVSALANAATFASMWRLNYFLIASPADVIMSAFIYGLSLALLALFVVLLSSVAVGANWLLKQSAGSKSIVEWLMEWTPIPEPFEAVFEALSKALNRRALFTIWRFTYIGIAILISLFAAGSTVLNQLRNDPAGREFLSDPVWLSSGLKVANLPEGGPKTCLQAKVLWLGSQAAVLRCSQGVRVMHGIEGLVTEQR